MRGIYFAGNFLSKSTGIRGVGEELAEGFSERNWQVFTASHHLSRFLRMVDFLWTGWYQRKHYQIAAVEIYSYLAFRWAELLCWLLRLLNKPYILTLHGGRLPEFARNNPDRFSKLLNSAVIVTTPSKYLKQEFVNYRDDIINIPNGIDLRRYPYPAHWQPGVNLIWLRAFHQIYNPGLAIEVLRRISPLYPNATLTMIGPDKGDGSLDAVNQLIKSYNLSEKVQIRGAISKNDLGYVLSQGDIFINTTYYESFGVSVLEAAACGLSIVTTNVGELPLIWENGLDALLVPPNDPDSMADAVKRIITEPGLAQRLSGNARNKAEQYDWSEILPRWEALIEDVRDHE